MTMKDLAQRLLGNGYTPIRLEPNSKTPKATGWQVDHPTYESIERAFGRPSNIGVRLGDVQDDGTCLIAIDIDLDVPELIRCVERAIGEKVPAKQGKKGVTYIVRMDSETKTHKIHWMRDNAKRAAIDLLGRGAQTVIPPSIHPDTGLPYRWLVGLPLEQISYDNLPVFSSALIDEIKGFCKNANDPIYTLNDMEWHGVGGGGNTHDICLSAVSSMVRRGWSNADIHKRIERAKREACEAAGMPYDWPQAQRKIQEWIDSARAKFAPDGGSSKKTSHGTLADAFLARGGHHILYDRDAMHWYFFDGAYWRAKYDFRVRNAIELSLPEELRNSPIISGVELSLRNRPSLSMRQQDWDPDPSLINTPAGVVDLKTGELRPAFPADRMTRSTEIAPADSCAGALWLEKLTEWFGDDPEEQAYFQTLAGYFLTGETRHACLPLWIGPGGDGKSVIANIFRYILGDYAKTSTDTAFVDTRQSQHSEELAWLNGSRLVLVNEIEGSLPWNDGRIKAVTGGEHIAASYKRGHVFEFRPSFKLLITGNEAPSLRSVGPEFRRRFHVYRFTRGVANPDPHLPEKLRAEAGAILRWMIDGAIRYYRDGLTPSPAVEAANREYFEDNDLIQQWINECCIPGDDCRVEGALAYENFVAWATAQGFRLPLTRPRFSSKLKAKGIAVKTATVPNRPAPVRCYMGIQLNWDAVGMREH